MDPSIPPHEVATTLRPLVYGAALAVMFTNLDPGRRQAGDTPAPDDGRDTPGPGAGPVHRRRARPASGERHGHAR